MTFSCIISSASKILKYSHFDFQIFVSPVLTAVVIIVIIVIIITIIIIIIISIIIIITFIVIVIIIIIIIIIVIWSEINAPFINWNLAIKS